MIKFVVIVAATCWMTVAPAKETNYEKIVAEWSSHVLKQKHRVTSKNNEKDSKRKNHFKIIEQWKTEIIKINSRHNKIINAFYKKEG